MSFLEKIENAINAFLVLIGSLLMRAFIKIVPPVVRSFAARTWEKILKVIAQLKALPKTTKPWVLNKLSFITVKLKAIDFKSKLKVAHSAALEKSNGAGKGKLYKIKTVALTPVIFIAGWLQGLSTMQSVLLLFFTSASILSTVSIVSSSKRIVDGSTDRAPASIEVEPEYERPGYYKEHTRHFGITNLRLPVFIPEVNEQRSVDIDFSATISNRATRKFLEKHEFELRDHFILNVEPFPASFPITEEGRIILQEKLHIELNDFLKTHQIDGIVNNVRLTYILAN